MLRPDTDVFFRLPSETNARTLHPAKLLTVDGNTCTASLASDSLAMLPRQEMLLYYDIRNKFSQQPIRIDALLDGDPSKVVAFTTTGDPVSAESRQRFRVTAAIAGLKVTVGAEPNSPLEDVSASGFSVICSAAYKIGQTVPVAFVHGGKKFSGNATVQSTREIEPGRVRYGMFCVGGRSGSGDLEKGLAQISTALQRAQLRRLAGG